MSRFKRLVVLMACLILFAVVAACDSSPAAQGGPTAPPNVGDAEAVADQFLTGWVNADYSAMYALLSPKALLMSPDEFAKTYKDVDEKLRTPEKGKSFEILHDQTKRQGNVVVITYNMTFDSGPLGKFTDSNRTMRLILTQDKWRVSWSTMDIFEGMAGGATLRIQVNQSNRGTIYDRNGKVIAMDGVKNYAVRLVPGKYPTGKAEDCFTVLADTFKLEYPKLVKEYGQYTEAQYGNFGFTVGTLTEGEYNDLKGKLDSVCKIDYQEQTTRYYYSGSFAAQTVGYMAKIPATELANYPQYTAETLVGRQGVERYYEKELAGSPGAQLVITSPDGIMIRSIGGKEPGTGQEIYLTLDRDVQRDVEKTIAAAYSAANWAPFSPGAAALVLDANNGNILAIASYPTVHPDAFLIDTTTFDADVLEKYQARGAQRNRAVQELYAPGSVFKIMSSAAVVNAGAQKMTDTYVCTGLWDGSKIGDKLRKDWIYSDKYSEKKSHGNISFQQALTASCDAYYWQVGSILNGMDAFALAKMASTFGLTQKSGIEIFKDIEAQGVVPDPDLKSKTSGVAWGLGDTLNTIIGQGDVVVTPLAISRMMVAVANGGTLYNTHIVDKVGDSYQYKAPTPTQIKLPQSAMQGIEAGLCNVTRDKTLGTAWYLYEFWDFSQVSVCGKTGTAQTGGPYPNGWFVAYASRTNEKPEIVVVAFVEKAHEGAVTAAPIVRRIIEYYYHLPLTNWPNGWYGPFEPVADPNVAAG